MNANEKQIGGEHYKTGGIECWDFVEDAGIGFTAGGAVKYILRFDSKGDPIQDLEKAVHYLEKWLEKQPAVHGNAFDAHRLLYKMSEFHDQTKFAFKFMVISHIINGIFNEQKRGELKKAIDLINGRIRILRLMR